MIPEIGNFRNCELQVRWREPGPLGDASQHARSDFFAIMEGKHEIWPTQSL